MQSAPVVSAVIHNRLRLILLSAIAMAAGCVVSNGPVASDPPPVVGHLPVLTLLPQTTQTQVGGGALISAAPAVYSLNQSYVGGVTGSTTSGICQLLPAPDRLVFVVNLSSGLPQIMQSPGMTTQLSAGGMPIETSVPTMVPPPYHGDPNQMQNQRQITIVGPTCSSIADNTVISLTMGSVITAVDPNGFPIARQDFTWYFNYTTQLVQQTPLPCNPNPNPPPQGYATDNNGWHDDQWHRDHDGRQSDESNRGNNQAARPAPAKKPPAKPQATSMPTTKPTAVKKR